MKIWTAKGIRSLLMVIFMFLFICFTGFAQSTGDEETAPDDQTIETPVENTNPEETAVPIEQEKAAQPLAAEGTTTNEFIKPDFKPSFDNKEIIPKAELYTGAATYSVPIVVPPGRGGIAVPNLALVYNNQNKNGILGMCWDLNLGYIQRSTKKGLHYDANEFIFNGSELVPVSGNLYQAKIEGEFARFLFHGELEGWEVTTRDGTKYYYGESLAKQPQYPANGKYYKWFLSRIVDTNGNQLTVDYWNYGYTYAQCYIEKITYSGNRVEFEYFESRPDNLIDYSTLFEIKTTWLLRRIKTFANGGTTPVRTYELTYEQGTNTGFSRLTQVQINSLPPIKFTWQGGGGTASFGNANEFQIGSSGFDICIGVADTNKDNKADLLLRVYGILTGQFSINTYLGTGLGTFDSSPKTTILEGGSADDIKVWYEDINNDGKIDVLHRQMSGFDLYIYCYLGIGNGFFTLPSNKTKLSDPSKKIYLVDINGDNSADIIQQDDFILTNAYIYLSNRDGTFNTAQMQPLTLAYNSEKFKFADINNDGFADIIQQDNTNLRNIDIYLSNGNGTFKPRITMTLPFYSDKIWFADFNGDGMVDMAQKDHDSLTSFTILISKGNMTFESLPQFTLQNGSNNIWMADVTGNGRADVFQANDFNTSSYNFCYLTNEDGSLKPPIQFSFDHGTYDLQFIDLNDDGLNDIVQVPSVTNAFNATYYTYIAQGTSPNYLITKIENGLGGSANIEYKSSSAWPNEYLPIKVQTVSKITTNDGLGNSSATSYEYVNGFYDVTEREFRGFGTVTQINPSPNNTKEITSFEQKNYYLKGLIKSFATVNPSGTTLQTVTNTWSTEALSSGVTFVKLTRKLTENFYSPKVSVQEDFTHYNTHGGVWTQITSSPTHPSPENITKTYEYQNYGSGTNGWVWKTTKETITGSASGKVRETYYTYYPTNGNMWTKTLWDSSKTEPEYPKVEITYDSYGNVASVKDARSNTTYTEYESTNSFPDKITAPQTTFNGRTRYHLTAAPSYDYRCGKPTQTIDENGISTYYYYDSLGRLRRVDHPDSGQDLYDYDDISNPRCILTRTLEPNGLYTYKYDYYDGLNRLIQTSTLGENNTPITARTYYDTMGRAYLTAGPFFSAKVTFPQNPSGSYPYKQNGYDYFSRVISVTSPSQTGNIVTNISYSGLDTTTTDPDNKQRKETKDYLGRITKVTEYHESGQFVTNYSYNAAGDLLTIQDAQDTNNITMTYDTLGRKKTMTHPDLGYWTYTYDKNNNLLTQTDAKGQIITFGYDALNRMVSKSYSTGQPTVYNIYDNLDLANGIGKLYATIQDTTPSGMKGFKTEYTYDVAGKTTSVLYPDSSRFYYQYYPSSGLLMNVLGSDQQTVYAHLCTYEPTGKIGQVTYGNLTATQYSYDSLSTRLTDIITHDPQFPNDPNKDFVHRHYTYSKAGDILGILDTAKGITTNYTYTYDNLHRLLTENSGGVYAAVAYAYSAIGNITSRQVGSNSMAYVYDTTKKHAVKTITYNSNTYTYYYDNNGNMTQGTDFTNLGQITQRTITYDTDNMPTQITEGSTTTNFTYDGDGDRVKKVTPGGATVYYVGDHYEVKDNENIKYLFAGNLRLIMIKGTNTFYYHKDHLNSTSVMTNNNAVVVETTQYEPFGATRAHTGTDMSGYKFTDQELDNESNLYNYDARLYDPVIGRFITGDSVMQDAHDPQKLNPYAYCRNNPLIYTDPTGRIIFAIEYNSNKQYGSYIITIKNWKIKIFDARTRADDNRPPVSNGIYSAHFGQHFGTRGNTPYDALRMVRYNTATSESTETDENRTLPAGLFGLDKRKYINIHRGDRMQPDKNGEVQETSSESCFVIPWSNNLKDKWQPNNPKSWGQYTEFISQYDKNDTNETVVVSRDIDRVRKVITFVPNAIINGIKKVIKNSSED